MSDESPTKKELEEGAGYSIMGDVVIEAPHDPYPFLQTDEQKLRAFVFANYGYMDVSDLSTVFVRMNALCKWLTDGPMATPIARIGPVDR